jgi:hypothetical protein
MELVRTDKLGSYASDNPVAGTELAPGKERYSILGYRRGTSTLTSIPRKREAMALKRAERRQEEEEEEEEEEQKKKKKKKKKKPTTKAAVNSNELEGTLAFQGHAT